MIGLLTFTQNLVVACSDIGQGNPTLVLWSVSLEEQFYFLWPILIFFAGLKRLRAIAIAMIIISFFARLYAIHLGAAWDMLWNATPLRLEPLAAGALIALAGNQHPGFGGKIRAAMLCAGIAIPVLCMADWTDSKWFNAARFPLATVGCSLTFLAIRGWTSKFLTSRPLVYLGKISYGLYVFHALTIDASPRFQITNPFTRTLVTFILTVALAAMSYRFLELPFLHLKERFAHIRSRPA
jgi:peptidoglycan/LPS O-acetylase OafA/YrhL